MITLHTRKLELFGPALEPRRRVLRISTDPLRPHPLRGDEIFLSRGDPVLPGYAAAAAFSAEHLDGCEAPAFLLPAELDHLAHGDVVTADWDRRSLHILYRRSSAHNSFLVTERCNHLCLMCSQPPRKVQDDWIIEDILAALPLMDPETREIGFTGGEPTLLDDRFLRLLRAAKSYLPRTAVHILSNGRRFADPEFATRYAAIRHPDIMVGIPLYSDVSTIHDYVVQADGAYDETIRGILRLKALGQKVELRVVVHKQTFERLPRLAEFIARNLTMVDHVALMGLEMMGFTLANLSDLWIDPQNYRKELRAAALALRAHRMNVSIYNHQLCLLDRELWPLARRSISDWKNEYMPECEGCAVMQDCGGFFASAIKRYSDHIRPVTIAS